MPETYMFILCLYSQEISFHMASIFPYSFLVILPCSFLVILLLLLPVSTIAQTDRNITLGSSITAISNGSSWTSPSGDFAFGFQQIETGKFLLAIWFNKIPEKTIVWSANGKNLVRQGSMIQLASDGGFLLSDPKGQEVWSANLKGSGTVAHAAMLDTGNFVLASQQGSNLWESFDLPTDTILPTQVLNTGSRLVARYSETNYSTGRFHLRMQTDGNLVLYTLTYPLDMQNSPYWSTKTVGSGYQVIFNRSGNIYLIARNESMLSSVTTTSGSTKDLYQRAILEHDGVFRQYVYPKSNGAANGRPMAWSSDSFVPPDICLSVTQETGGGACGFNSYCSLGNDQRPQCRCLPGYSFLDSNDQMSGCKQDFAPQVCGGSQDANNFDFRDMQNTDWPLSDYEHYQQVSEDWCRQACLVDCFCAVAIFSDGNCWKKKLPLSNGRLDSSVDRRALIKVRKDNSTYRPRSKGSKGRDNRSTLILVGSLLLSSSVFINLLLLIAGIFVLSHFRKERKLHLHPVTQGMNLLSFTYQELEEATSKFKEELGKGAFSTVYKGVSDKGNNGLIAVKKLDRMVTEGEKEFQAEMGAIGRTHHKNLVQLLGFCNEGEHRILVYEYMSNGSLASYLFGDTRPNWCKRMQIAFGIARGLVYLHEECSNQIIHCDIKPQNVLLDDSFNARISDFGLAKLLKTDQTRTLTAIRGTKGYVAPEWFKSMPITAKVDVYSFGILLLELICCRKNFDQDAEDEGQMVLVDWAYDCYEQSRMYLLIRRDEEAIEDARRVEKFVMIAIWCIQDEPTLRPTMKKVLQMLEGAVEVPLPPLHSDLSLTT